MKLTALGFCKHTSDNYSRECLYSNVRKQYELNCMLKNIENSTSMEKLCRKMKKKILWLLGVRKSDYQEPDSITN